MLSSYCHKILPYLVISKIKVFLISTGRDCNKLHVDANVSKSYLAVPQPFEDYFILPNISN